jgi:hypothetical protein
MQMDNKSGVILGVCVIIAACILAFASRQVVPASEIGRYQFERSNGVNVFVLDTKTGRIWQRFVEPTGGNTEWSENKAPWTEASGK